MSQLSHRPTPESIDAAKQHQANERAKVEAATGVRIGENGRPQIVIAHCLAKGCLFVAARGTEDLAVRAVATHYSLKHGLSLVRR